MHPIDNMSPSTKSMVRDQVFRVLAHFASNRNYGPISVKRLFLIVADELVKAGTIERPGFLGGQQFAVLIEGDQPQLFPNYELPEGVAIVIRQTIWELYMGGILAPAFQESPNINVKAEWMFLDAFLLTPYGVQILADNSGRIRVYDPDGYTTNFTSTGQQPDEEMMRYISEGIRVFNSGHFLAAVVLIGIASERLIDVLAEPLRAALGDRAGADFYGKYKGKRDISSRFDYLKNTLMGTYGDALGAANLKDPFQKIVTLTFETIRAGRNDIAHPSGRQFSWNEVSGFLHNFVQSYKYIERIIAFLKSNPKTSGATPK